MPPFRGQPVKIYIEDAQMLDLAEDDSIQMNNYSIENSYRPGQRLHHQRGREQKCREFQLKTLSHTWYFFDE